MEDGKNLRPRVKVQSNQRKSTTANTTGSTTTTANTIPSLMSLAPTQIPVSTEPTTSQQAAQQNVIPLDAERTFNSPEHLSPSAQEIRNQFQALRVSQRVGDSNEMVINDEGLTLKEYVTASIGVSQALVLNQVKESIQQLVPQIVREVIKSEKNPSSATMNQSPSQPPYATMNQFTSQPPLREQDVFPRASNEYQRASLPHPQNIQQKPLVPSDLEKWGIKFDGSRKTFTVEDFVFRVESLQVDYNCPMTILMKGFHHLLAGNAYEWFWTFRRENPHCEWDQLKFYLIRKFRRFESDTEIQRCIMERRQHPAESSETFIGEIIMLKNQLSRSIREEELVRIVKDNLKDGLYQLIYPINIRSFDHLLDECRRAERNIAKRSNHRQLYTRRVNEVDYSQLGEDNKFDIEALKATPPARQLICWNCRSPGHTFVECTSEQRKLFCYKCGFENVITPKCPKCTGNQ